MKDSTTPVRVFARQAVFAALATLLMGTFCLSFSQTLNTRVRGTVKDPAEAVVPGVKITLTDMGTKVEKTAVTNDEGVFVFADVAAGTYMVSAELRGFKKLQVQNIEVHVDKPVILSNIVLETGGVDETVSVTASETQALIRSEDAKLSTTVDVKQVQDLPLNGRNPMNIAGGMAGVNTNGSVRTSAINGLRGSFSNITWDGININDNLVRTDSLFGSAAPSVASVSEFTVTTQNGGPEDGLGIAQVKLTTPRGGSSYHGQGYDFYRNAKFDANTFFNNATRDPKTGLALPKPGLIQHQYGFNVGGPFAVPRFGEGGPMLALKNKLFFYFFYEGIRTTSEDTRLRTVLSAGARTGNYTYLATCGVTGQPACPAGITNGQPRTVNVFALAPGRTIDPRITTLINLTPPSNNDDQGDKRNTQGFRFNSPSGSTSDHWGFRFDYDINSRNRVEAIYHTFIFNFPNDTFNDIGEVFPGLPGGGQDSKRPSGSFAWNWSPTSNISNEVRFGFYKTQPQFITQETFSIGYRLNLPLISNPIQNFLKQGRIPKNYDTIDNVTWVKGNHVVRFGGSFRAVEIYQFNDGNILPTYTIAFNTTGNRNPMTTSQFPGGISSTEFTSAGNLLALLTGAVSSAAQAFNVSSTDSGFVKGLGTNRDVNYNALGLYAGDTWRARPNLSLNLGLRWEYIGPTTEASGLGLLPTNTSLEALRDPNAALGFAGDGTGRPLHKRDLNNFAPSFSFAWDPFKNGTTSLRGGYALSYAIDNNVTVINSAINGNAGLASTVTLTGLSGTVTSGGIIPIPTPAFKVPRTLVDQLGLSQTPVLWAVDPKLATPYVQQWNLGIEREIFKDTAISVGYVGNHGLKLIRSLDINQVVIFQNGFFADFLRAQANLALTGNPACTTAGCQTLTVFPKLGLQGNLGDPSIRNLITQGQVGELASTYVSQRNTYLTIGANGNTSTTTGFFLTGNPNALQALYIGNGSFSNYHGLQAEIRKRLSNGFYYQANYTWSKAFTDSEQSQTENAPLLDLTLGNVLEKKRLSQDVAHVFKGNAVYELPFGPGKRFWNGGSFVGRVVGGWQISGIFQARTGRPISFISGRGTRNRSGRSGKNTATTTLTIAELQGMTGLFYNPTNGRPLLFDPKLIGSDGRANLEFLTNPAAGQFGSLSLTPVSGPGFWNADMALIKRTKISETTNLELRLEAFNLFNHTNFSVGENNDINSVNFGKITSTFEPRILQLAIKFNF